MHDTLKNSTLKVSFLGYKGRNSHCLYLSGGNCAEDVDDAVGLLLALLGELLAEQLAAAQGQTRHLLA